MLSRFFDFDHDLATTFALANAFDRRFQPTPPARFSELTLRDEGDHFTLSATIPGVPKDALDLSIEGKLLTVKAKRKGATEKDGKESLLFQKTIDLGVRVEGELATASLEDGILTVTLPKTAAAKPRKIPIGKSEPAPAQA